MYVICVSEREIHAECEIETETKRKWMDVYNGAGVNCISKVILSGFLLSDITCITFPTSDSPSMACSIVPPEFLLFSDTFHWDTEYTPRNAHKCTDNCFCPLLTLIINTWMNKALLMSRESSLFHLLLFSCCKEACIVVYVMTQGSNIYDYMPDAMTSTQLLYSQCIN